MNRQIIFFLGINYVDGLEFADQYTGITYLAAAFGVERSMIEYDLIQCLIFLFYLTVTQNRYFVFCVVITDKFTGSFF